ncbi:CocE/NonD family hydrolase [Microbacterium sp. EST19A]|uniref:CocE/NonD family hydrolase n=1 Tax=Microbacterium sp. EST19A TaxID=2862681 RepID=UPI001CC16FAF|nr:CocE/NonD family hydrolase [Microbacterium sp. EST19A]
MQDLHDAADLTVKRLTTVVSMPDGVDLATDILIPVGVAPRATIIERTPYGRKAALHGLPAAQFQAHLEELCLEGFTVIVQDCRGTGDSGGVFTKYVNEAADGLATIRWATTHAWFGAGAILMGVSYSAHAALAAAVAGAPALLGLYLDRGGFWSAFHEGIRLNGAFELKQATWALSAARRAAADQGDTVRVSSIDQQALDQWLLRLPWRHGRSPLRFDREREDDLLSQWDQDTFDRYWEQPSLSARGKASRLEGFPSLQISSWYDIYPMSTVKIFHELERRPNGDAYLILGPWTHSGIDDTFAGDVEFGQAASLEHAVGCGYFELRKRWFSHSTLPLTGFRPRVTFFLMGGGAGTSTHGRLNHGGEWLAAEQWPPSAAEASAWVLGSKGTLNPHPALLPAPDEFTTFRYDPRHPVPTVGGGIGSYPGVFEPGAFDQRERPGLPGCAEPYLPLLSRPDVLSFSSDPLNTDLAITGSPIVRMDFSTTGEDTDVTVKLVDHYPPSEDHPDGFAMNLCDTVVRLRAIEDPELIDDDPTRLTVHLEIEMPPIANRFATHHRIRLDISSSNFPRVDANNNLLGQGPRAAQAAVVINGVRTGGPRVSTLQLPVVPVEAIDDMRDLQLRSVR